MNARCQALAVSVFFACLQVALGTSELTLLHSFGFNDSSAANPYAELTLATDGTLYGTTSAGGKANQGTIFRMKQDGSGFQLLKIFGAATNDGARPLAAILEGRDGALYGTTEEGGAFGFGTI